MIVYSCTDRESFERIDFWVNEVKKHAPENAAIVIVCNKVDLVDQRIISKEEGEQLASKFGVEHFEVSAKTNIGINEAFQRVAELAVKKFIIYYLFTQLTFHFDLLTSSTPFT